MAAEKGALVQQLISDAEIVAEQTVGLVRIAITLLLAAWMAFISFRFGAPFEDSGPIHPLHTAGIALIGLLVAGVISFVLASTGRFRPWMTFAFVGCDAFLIASGIFVSIAESRLSGNWVPAIPVVWAVPLLLALGALRYRPVIQIWATGLFAVSLGIVAVALGFEPGGPVGGSTDTGVRHLFSLAPNLVREAMLVLMGLVTAVGMRRGRSLLVTAVSETARRANLSRFLPSEIAPLVEGAQFSQWREGRRQQTTILFVDIRDFTARAEDMDPKRLSIFVASFRRRVLRAAAGSGGVVDKFIGDGALILFGLPEPRPDDVRKGLDCARELLRLIERWNAKRKFDPPVRIGIGIHAGEAYCGVLGDESRLEFTVLGDAVNVAARIEQATKQFGLPLLASEAVVDAAGERSEWRVISSDPPRGHSGPVTILAPA